jgi:hypothetical protein
LFYISNKAFITIFPIILLTYLLLSLFIYEFIISFFHTILYFLKYVKVFILLDSWLITQWIVGVPVLYEWKCIGEWADLPLHIALCGTLPHFHSHVWPKIEFWTWTLSCHHYPKLQTFLKKVVLIIIKLWFTGKSFLRKGEC